MGSNQTIPHCVFCLVSVQTDFGWHKTDHGCSGNVKNGVFFVPQHIWGFSSVSGPRRGCPLSMRVAVATKRCPVYTPSYKASFCRPKMQRCVQKGSPSCLIDMYMASSPGRPSVYLHGASQIQNLFRLQPSGMLGQEGGRVSCNLTEACPASPRNNVVVTGRYLWGAQE